MLHSWTIQQRPFSGRAHSFRANQYNCSHLFYLRMYPNIEAIRQIETEVDDAPQLNSISRTWCRDVLQRRQQRQQHAGVAGAAARAAARRQHQGQQQGAAAGAAASSIGGCLIELFISRPLKVRSFINRSK